MKELAPEPGAPRRKFAVAVKHSSGDWRTYEAIEILLAEPVEVNASVPGMMLITAGADDTEDARP